MSLPIILRKVPTNNGLQLTFFIIVSSSDDYAEYLGGTATFSGLVIGVPTSVAAIMLLPLMYFDKGERRMRTAV